jgi:hypothetical protein
VLLITTFAPTTVVVTFPRAVFDSKYGVFISFFCSVLNIVEDLCLSQPSLLAQYP